MSASLGLTSGPAACLMVPGTRTLPVRGMSERPRMGVILAQDLLEDLATELQRQEGGEGAVVGQRLTAGRVTIFQGQGVRNNLGEEVVEVELQRKEVEQAEMEEVIGGKQEEDQMGEEENQMVEQGRRIMEEAASLVDPKTEPSLAAAKERLEDVLIRSCKPV